MKFKFLTPAMFCSAAFVFLAGCGGGNKTPGEPALNYTDPAPGNGFRFIKNTDLSTKSKLVLDLVARGQADESAGIAFMLSLNRTNIVNWARVSDSYFIDPDFTYVQNGAVFDLGIAPIGVKSRVSASGAQLQAVVAQKGIDNLKNLNSGVLARVALSLKPDVSVTSGTVRLTVDEFQIIPNTRTVTAIPLEDVLLGTLDVQN